MKNKKPLYIGLGALVVVGVIALGLLGNNGGLFKGALSRIPITNTSDLNKLTSPVVDKLAPPAVNTPVPATKIEFTSMTANKNGVIFSFKEVNGNKIPKYIMPIYHLNYNGKQAYTAVNNNSSNGVSFMDGSKLADSMEQIQIPWGAISLLANNQSNTLVGVKDPNNYFSFTFCWTGSPSCNDYNVDVPSTFSGVWLQ